MALPESCFGCCGLRHGSIVIALCCLLNYLATYAVSGLSVIVVAGASLGVLLLAGAYWRNAIILWIWIVGNFFLNVLICMSLFLGVHEGSVKIKAHDIDGHQRHVDFKTTYFVFATVIFIGVLITFVLFNLIVYSYICELRRDKRCLNDARGNSNAPPEANNLVRHSEFSVRFENAIDEMFNKK